MSPIGKPGHPVLKKIGRILLIGLGGVLVVGAVIGIVKLVA